MTKEEYAEYQKRFTQWAEKQDYESSGKCPDCLKCEDAPDELGFSWRVCEICQRPEGGERFAAHSVDSDGEILHWEICSDCAYYMEYYQLDDMTMLKIERGDA